MLGKELRFSQTVPESLIDDDSADIYLNPFFTRLINFPTVFRTDWSNHLSCRIIHKYHYGEIGI